MYEKILVAVDGSEASLRGLAEGIRIAKSTGALLLLLHVLNASVLESEFASVNYLAIADALRTSGSGILERAATVAREAGVPFECKLIDQAEATAADEIIDRANDWQADLIVLGTHGRRGLKRLVMGSDAEVVLRRSTVPVLMVRASAP